MSQLLSFKIYRNASDLPENWNDLSGDNIFLTHEYLRVLDTSAPKNMTCLYIGFYQNDELCGVSISQFLNLNQLRSFGDRDKRLKSAIRNFIFKNLNSHVLFVGNNMLTGQNAFNFSAKINSTLALESLKVATAELQNIFRKAGTKIHITTYKDFAENDVVPMKIALPRHYCFSIHPNMVFDILPHWKSFDDYIAALTKKYRDQYKRSLKRSDGVVRRKMKLQEILKYEESIYCLYSHVAENAPLNTFLLAKNHFAVLKQNLGDNFKFYGYFENGKLIGFNTLIKNGRALETYFLGYDSEIQREKMLYLTMLYDMIGYAIKNKFEQIIFARTALEIKSSVGAVPVTMYGLLEHRNSFLQKYMSFFFNYFEPKIEWKHRSPFK